MTALRRPRLFTALLACAVALVACDDAEGGPAPGGLDAGPEDAGGGPPDAGGRPDAARLPDASRGRVDDDGNTGFGEALPLVVGGEPVAGVIADDDDFDYLRFEATAGQYLAVLQLEDSGFFPPSVVLLDPDMRVVAGSSDVLGCAGDDGVPTEIVTRAARTGTYHVELLTGLRGYGEPDAPWSVRVVDLATSPATRIVSEGGGATVTDAHRCVFGAFEAPDDEDVVPVDLPAFRGVRLYDPGRHGSTGRAQPLELVDGDGRLVARSREALLLDDVPAPAVRVRAPADRGDNDHYLLLPGPAAFHGPDVYFVSGDEPTNDDAATPEPLPIPEIDDEGYPAPFVVRVGPGDVDHLAVELAGEGSLSIECGAEAYGMSPRELEVRLLDGAGGTRARGRESATLLAGFSATLDPGRHVLRFAAPRHEAGLSGVAALCVMTIEES